ncbi:MAG TPA: type II toxin-antitoxin system VapB family antitoxin [Polyangia bacterium]|nr:type II toxin-antitoxin system VapB family antitoxin [Polyangia bacterium]
MFQDGKVAGWRRFLVTKRRLIHAMRMKRANLVLRDDLLEEATRLSGEKTYSRVVERSLEEFIARRKAQQILSLQGSGLWQGDLAVVRRDAPARRARRR